jgi:hypothetical protein
MLKPCVVSLFVQKKISTYIRGWVNVSFKLKKKKGVSSITGQNARSYLLGRAPEVVVVVTYRVTREGAR